MGKQVDWNKVLNKKNELIRLNKDVIEVLHIGQDRLTIKDRLETIMRDVQNALADAIKSAYKPDKPRYKRTDGIWKTVTPEKTKYSLEVHGHTVSIRVDFDTTHYHKSYFIEGHPKVNTLWLVNDGYKWKGLEKQDYIWYFNIRPEFDIVGEMMAKLKVSYSTTYAYIRDYGIHIEVDFGREVL